MGENYTEQRVSFFKAEKTQSVKIWNHHWPNPKKNSFQLQQVSSLEMNLLKNIFSLQIHVPAAMNSIPQILSSKSHFWKETVPETAYFTFSGPQKAQSKLSLFANQIQSPPHPPATNGTSAADPLTHAKVIPHSQSSTFFSLHLLCLFNTYNSRNKLILFVTTAKKKTPRNPKQNLKRLDLFSLNQNRKYQKKISFKIILHVRTQLFSLSALV